MMELRRVRLGDAVVEPLLHGLAAEYGQRYGLSIGAGEMAAAGADEFDAPDGAFLVLLDGERTVAGAGLRRWTPSTCEVKRMWTAPDRRRQGHAVTVLHALEEAARALGYQRIRLVTGPAQPEAVALYVARGYEPVPIESAWGALAFEGDLAGPGG